jgi:hypothetical protein
LPTDTTFIITETVSITIAAICDIFQKKVNRKSNDRNNKPYKKYTGVVMIPWPDQEGNKLHSPHFMELGGLLPHSQESTTCPYP